MKPDTIGHANARPCNLCGSIAHRQKYVIKDYRIVECEQCGFVFLGFFPEHTLADIYQEGYFRGDCANDQMVNVTGWDYFDSGHYAEVRQRSRQTLEHLERFISPGKILDIGCGPGIFLSEALSRGWTAHGFDLSAFAVQYANENLKLSEVKQMDVGHMDYPDNSFNAVTLFHVIEHVPDPRELVQTCNRIIKPGGILLVETPDISSRRAKNAGADWKYLKIPEHVSYFTLKTLSRLVAGAGFKPLDVKRATESTGLMIKFCGGKEKARLFYDRWVQQKWFRCTTGKIRKLKETVSGKILRDFDNITIVAKKA